jgi:CubicO group peptidase (beta-lactamase class C family)
MKSPPGSRFSYSNSGFLVLGLIIEKLEGRNFRSCIEDRVFAPAAMGQRGFFVADALPAQTARGYIENKDGTLRSNVFAVPAIGGPDGGAYVTAADMLRFWEALFDGHLLSQAMIDSIRTIAIGPTDGRLRYSLGFWRADSWSRDAWFVLMGADPGVSFVSAYSPDTRDGFVILSNADNRAFSLLKPIRELFREA